MAKIQQAFSSRAKTGHKAIILILVCLALISDAHEIDKPKRTFNTESFSTEQVDKLMRASVRYVVPLAPDAHLGSGTAIHRQAGSIYYATCGHTFRNVPKAQKIEIALYPVKGNPPKWVTGEVIDYDLEGDVGLIKSPDTTPGVETVPLVADPDEVDSGELFCSIGSSLGADPSSREVKVIAVDVYEGPQNFLCSTLPELGRSGGGTFNIKGELTGVCILADKSNSRGVYAGTMPLRKLLRRNGLTNVVPKLPGANGSFLKSPFSLEKKSD